MMMWYAHLAPEHTQFAVDLLAKPLAATGTKSDTGTTTKKQKISK
jgi:hypothetical protein